jgi:hypothetical protein
MYAVFRESTPVALDRNTKNKFLATILFVFYKKTFSVDNWLKFCLYICEKLLQIFLLVAKCRKML